MIGYRSRNARVIKLPSAMYGDEDIGKGEPTKTLFDPFLDRETTTRFESARVSPSSAFLPLSEFG